ncbi:MAG: colanic acid/amylovoran biosynthesis glycosyltransferase, partial [Enterobacterales bacterium]
MKIAYLAPEIPALSATFVYNEILQLEKIGHDVVPFSIHKPRVLAQDDKLTGLRARVRYLYQRSKRQVLQA